MFSKSSAKTSLAIGFLLLVLVLVANALISYRNVRQLNEDGQLVSRALEVQSALGNVETGISRCTANQRGYLLTSDPFFKQRYRENVQLLDVSIRRLRELAQSLEQFPADEADLDQVEQAIEDHVASLDRLFDQPVQTREPAVVDEIAGGEAVVRREAIRNGLARLRSHQDSMLTHLQLVHARTYSSAVLSLTLTGIVGLLLLAFYLWLVQRYVSSRAEAESATRAHRAVLQATLNGIRDGVVATDARGSITFLNPTAEQLVGWTTADAIGKPIEAVCGIVDERTRQRLPGPLAPPPKKEDSRSGIHHGTLLIDRAGESRPVEEAGAPIVDDHGRTIGAVLVIRDVTERRAQERELIERETQIRSLLDSTDEAICGLNLDGVCTFCNAASLRMLGYGRQEDLVGRPLGPLVHHDAPDASPGPEADWAIGKATRNGDALHGDDQWMRRQDGSAFPVEYRCTPVHREGALVGSVVTFLDITERRRGEAAAAERERLVALRAAKAAAMSRDAPLPDVLRELTSVIATQLGAAAVRIWTLEEDQTMLRLRASGGEGADAVTNSAYERVRVGERRVGRVALTGEPLVDEGPAFDPRATNPRWTSREKVVAFAGFPLRVEGRTVGVLAVLSRLPLTPSVLAELPPMADGLGQYIERREAERRLRESEQRLRLTVEAADIGTWDYNLRTGVLEWSERCKTMFGLAPDDAVSYERFLEILHPDDRDRVEAVVARASDPEGNGEYDTEFRAVWPDRSLHWIVAKGQGFFEPEGERPRSGSPPRTDTEGEGDRRVAVRLLGTAMDVTHSRQAAAELAASEARFRQLADAMPQIVWVADAEGRREYYNRRWYDYSGCAPDACVGQKLDPLLHADDRERAAAVWDRSLASGEPYQIEYRLESSGGDSRWFLVRALPVRDEAGTIVKWYGTSTDIEDKKRFEETLRRSEEFARSVLESSPDCVKIVDLEGRLLWMNQNGQQLFQVEDFEGVRGRSWADFWSEGGHAASCRAAIEAAAAGGIGRFQGMCRTLAGVPRWWDVAVTPVRGPQEEVERLLCVSRDVTADREGQERLRISEENLRHVLDSMLPFVAVIDPAGELIEVNQSALTVTGLRREEVIGKPFWECDWWSYDTAASGRIREAFRRAASGEFVRYDEACRVLDDGRMTVDFQLQPVYHGDGLKFVVASAVDITDRKRAEDQLANSQQFLRSSLDALSSHIAVLDERGTILTVNESWKRFGGQHRFHAPFCTVGTNYLAACEELPGADVDGEIRSAADAIRGVIAGERPRYSVQYSWSAGEGNGVPGSERRWFQMTVTRFLGTGEARVVVAHEDITRQIESQELMRSRSEQLRRLADVATELTAANDLQSILRIVTEGAKSLLGGDQAMTSHVFDAQWSEGEHFICRDPATPAAVPAIPFPDGLGLADRVCGRNQIVRLTRADDVQHGKASQAAARSWIAAPLVHLDGTNLGMIQLAGKRGGGDIGGGGADFTHDDESVLVQLSQMASVAIENARLYSQLQESIRRKDEFLAMLGHELRNPLAGIVSGVDALGMLPLPGEATEMQAVIGRQAAHMSRIVDDLLDVSRIVRGKLTLRPEPVRLNDLVRNVVRDYASAQGDDECEIRTEVCGEEIWIEGDMTRLNQVLSNLLHNSCKFGDGSNVVTLGLRRGASGRDAVVSVKDQGIGMTAETLSRIFEPFNQADVSLDRSRGGLGLGLALVKGLVRLHGGSVTASSAGLHQGAEFTIVLPTIAAPSSKAPESESTAIQPCRVLLIDDRRDAILPIRSMLSKDGHTVQTASDGPEGIQCAETFQPDVILCDIGLTPPMSGYDVARELRSREEFRETYMVAVTGYTQDEYRQRAFEAGFDYHVKKPVDLHMLRKILASRARF
ncbi:PAS domain S-box protein [Planctomyces sp. SH-PL14]|uniref:PAS domain S-box protein n=1 Tax=Planctomyces sp. SH-PL14 TaxID=1632864 RepID=UPI0018D474BF|nr:PAS domain S-box protein [Planctomyces sp. SH-PL14]